MVVPIEPAVVPVRGDVDDDGMPVGVPADPATPVACATAAVPANHTATTAAVSVGLSNL
jgi:hypothetical protein